MENNKPIVPENGQNSENQAENQPQAIADKLAMAKEYVAYKNYLEQNGITNQGTDSEPLFGKLKIDQTLLEYKLGRIDSIESAIKNSVANHASKRYRTKQFWLLGIYVALTVLLIVAGWGTHAHYALSEEVLSMSGIVHSAFYFVIWVIFTAFAWKQFNVLHREQEERLNEYYKVLYELNKERYKLLN